MERIIYYTDPLQDDFAGNHIDTADVGADFPFIRQDVLFNALGFLLYYLIAIPLVWLLTKLCLGLKMENRKVLRQVRKGTFYLYGNHTQSLDAVVPALAAFPKRAYVISHRDAVSIPGLRTIVQMLGAIPVPSEIKAMPAFAKALEKRAQENACIAIFPEAHVWPYYTGVRPFHANSFRYPVKAGRPVVAMAATYRKRRGLLFWVKRPAMTLTFSEPFYPDASLSPRQAQEALRRQVYDFLKERTGKPDNIAYVQYIQKTDPV